MAVAALKRDFRRGSLHRHPRSPRSHGRGRIEAASAESGIRRPTDVLAVDPLWQHRLVRAEVDVKKQRIDFYTLRRRAPDQQPLVKETKYVLPRRKFAE